MNEEEDLFGAPPQQSEGLGADNPLLQDGIAENKSNDENLIQPIERQSESNTHAAMISESALNGCFMSAKFEPTIVEDNKNPELTSKGKKPKKMSKKKLKQLEKQRELENLCNLNKNENSGTFCHNNDSNSENQIQNITNNENSGSEGQNRGTVNQFLGSNYNDPNQALMEYQEAQFRQQAKENADGLMSLLAGRRDNPYDRSQGLLNLEMNRSGPQFVQNELRLKDGGFNGKVKNPKKRKMYEQNPQLQLRQNVSFAQLMINSKNENDYRPKKIKQLMVDPQEDISSTKQFLKIIDNDLMNPFGGGHKGFTGSNINQMMNIPNPNGIVSQQGSQINRGPPPSYMGAPGMPERRVHEMPGDRCHQQYNRGGPSHNQGNDSYVHGRGNKYGGGPSRNRKKKKVEEKFDPEAAPKFALSSLSNMPQNMVQKSMNRLKSKRKENAVYLGKETYGTSAEAGGPGDGGNNNLHMGHDDLMGFQNMFRRD